MKIMIVDNDDIVRFLFKKQLMKMRACDIVEASNGYDALAKMKEEKPDLLVLDLNMPKVGGVEVLQSLRRHPEFKTIPVVILSSTDDKEVIKQQIILGISDYILKPVDIKPASERIFKALGIDATT